MGSVLDGGGGSRASAGGGEGGGGEGASVAGVAGRGGGGVGRGGDGLAGGGRVVAGLVAGFAPAGGGRGPGRAGGLRGVGLGGGGGGLGGGCVGALAGLVPGLHPNTLALGALALGFGGVLEPSAGVALLGGLLGAWTFSNAVPLIVLGVPEGEDAPALLPGQRLAREGLTGEALVASARGSLVGCVFGCGAALGLAAAFEWVDPGPLLGALTPWVQAGALVVLVLTDPSGPFRAGGLAVLSGVLGWVALPLPVSSPVGLPSTSLAPLFIGLFGLPALVHAARAGAPREPIPRLVGPRVDKVGAGAGVLGSGLGVLAGTFAGFTSGPATAVAVLVKRGGDASVLATTAAVNTSAVCVATGMLHAAGRTRTGTHAAQLALQAPVPGVVGLPEALASLGVGACVGLVLLAGARRCWRAVAGWVPRVAPVLVVVWGVLIGVQTGWPGFLVAGAGWSTARAAAALGTRRSVLMSCLLVPGLANSLF